MTTDLRSKASKEIIRKVKERQSKGLPCKVVSTTMYENVWWIVMPWTLMFYASIGPFRGLIIHVRHEDVTGVRKSESWKSNSF